MSDMKNVDFDTITKRMQNIVNRTLKGYKSDFEIDKKLLREAQEANHPVSYIWVTRELGTQLVKLHADQEDYLNSIRNIWKDHNEYLLEYSPVNGWSIRKLNEIKPYKKF